MNRKIQETDRAFILARYRRDPHAFSARSEASAHDVSVRTIYNLLAQEGIQMRRGRKPLIPPDILDYLPPPGTLECPPPAYPPAPLSFLPPLYPPKPQTGPRRGPPIIRPRGGVR